MHKSLFLAATMAVIGTMATAAPFSVYEDTDFDNAISHSNSSVGTTGIGVNNIYGSLSGSCMDDPEYIDCNYSLGSDEQDSFAFTIGAGQILTKIAYGSEGNGPDGLEIGFAMDANVAAHGWSNIGYDFLPVNTYDEEDSLLGLGEGTYYVSVWGDTANEAGDYGANWSIALTIAEVPLPAGLPLLLTALGAVGISRTRRK